MSVRRAVVRLPAEPRTLPLVGVRSVEQLADNLGSLALRRDADQLRRLDEATRVRLGYLHEFLHERGAALAIWQPVDKVR
jgi:hypothetical protein